MDKFKLDNVIPLGRRYSEYKEIFGLNDSGTHKKILDCASGPSSFNSEARKLGMNVISIDPLYEFEDTQIKQRIDETFDGIMKQCEENKNSMLWVKNNGIEKLRELRKSAMDLFLEDYREYKDIYYLNQQLPKLSLVDNEFDLVICSHLLFLYSDILDYEFHEKSILEMLRVGNEVRIFPILNLDFKVSKHLEDIISKFQSLDYDVELIKVDYEFMTGGNQYLSIKNI